jgi:hypothetical protein
MRGIRVVAGAGLALYGVSYLWLSPAAAAGDASGPRWALGEVFVSVSGAAFLVAAWGLAAVTRWGSRMAAAAAVAGLLTLAPYLAAMQGERSGSAIANTAAHAAGCAAILLALAVPRAERLLSRRARPGSLPPGPPGARPLPGPSRVIPAGHHSGGWRPAHGRAASSWADSEISVPSSPMRPASITPIGKPWEFQCSGTFTAGCPVTLNTAV